MSKWLIILVVFVVAGCAEESTIHERQDKAMKDPYNYSPFEDRTDISGGGLMEFKKDAFKKDVGSVFNP